MEALSCSFRLSADLPSESDESNSTEPEAEFSENSDDSAKFMSLLTL